MTTETKKPKGGKQPGAGRKPLPEPLKRKQRNYYLTDHEDNLVRDFIAQIRTQQKP